MSTQAAKNEPTVRKRMHPWYARVLGSIFSWCKSPHSPAAAAHSPAAPTPSTSCGHMRRIRCPPTGERGVRCFECTGLSLGFPKEVYLPAGRTNGSVRKRARRTAGNVVDTPGCTQRETPILVPVLGPISPCWWISGREGAALRHYRVRGQCLLCVASSSPPLPLQT